MRDRNSSILLREGNGRRPVLDDCCRWEKSWGLLPTSNEQKWCRRAHSVCKVSDNQHDAKSNCCIPRSSTTAFFHLCHHKNPISLIASHSLAKLDQFSDVLVTGSPDHDVGYGRFGMCSQTKLLARDNNGIAPAKRWEGCNGQDPICSLQFRQLVDVSFDASLPFPESQCLFKAM